MPAAQMARGCRLHPPVWKKGVIMTTSVTRKLKELIERAETWPSSAQEELVQVGLEIEAEHKSGTYTATADELKAIDEALAQADRGEVLSEEEAETAFERFRGA